MKKAARKTAAKAEQKMLPFDEPSLQEPAAVPLAEMTVSLPAAAPIRTRYEPSGEARESVVRLEAWLRDPNTGRPVNDLAEETLRSLARALLEGKNAWWHHAEERLEALLACPSAVGIRATNEGLFRSAVDDVLDCLHDRLADRGR